MWKSKLRLVFYLVIITTVILLGLCSEDSDNGIALANGSGQVITLSRVGRSKAQGRFASSAAEIVAWDAIGKQIFTVNANSGRVDVFDLTDVTAPAFEQSIDAGAMLISAGLLAPGEIVVTNSVDIYADLAAIAVEAVPRTKAGWVVFVKPSDLSFVQAVQVGSLPDMLTFTADGSKVVVAIEGEPGDYTEDPKGLVEIINTRTFAVRTVSFDDFNTGGSREAELPDDVRIFGQLVDTAGTVIRESTVAEDLEPEYVAISADSSKAYVSLQENNAVAVVDLATATVDKIFALGFKDHRVAGNELDVSDRDDQVNITNWPVFGMYQPDSIASYQVNGVDYFVTANEGDARADWGIKQKGAATDFAGDPLNVNMEAFRVKDLLLDASVFDDETLQHKENLGRLKVTSKMGDTDGDGDFDELYAYGARSFSIWNATTGDLVFDSGSDFERITALKYGNDFNNNHDELDPDGRSDEKGPEPEAIAVGKINSHSYAFIGLERMGGVMVYDISNPDSVDFVEYINPRDLTKDSEVDEAAAGDLGPEGFKFVSADKSPNGKPLLLVGNEVSGTTSVYQIDVSLPQN